MCSPGCWPVPSRRYPKEGPVRWLGHRILEALDSGAAGPTSDLMKQYVHGGVKADPFPKDVT